MAGTVTEAWCVGRYWKFEVCMVGKKTSLTLIGCMLVGSIGGLHAEEARAPGVSINYVTGSGKGGRNSGDAVLRVVRRGHTGGVIALQVASAVLLRGFSTTGFKKSQLDGEKIEEIPNPGETQLVPAVQAKLDAYLAQHPGAAPAEPHGLLVTGNDWVLIYQELGNDKSLYELRYSTGISLNSEKGGKGSMQCKPEPLVKSLQEWEGDSYAKVKEAANAYVAECAEHFAKSLPTLLPDAAKPETQASVASAKH